CGKQRTFPTSPHPRLRRRTNIKRGVTLTFHLVQKIGQVTQQQRDRLVALNEIQHKLASQILALLKNSNDRYPDRDFLLILLGLSKRDYLKKNSTPRHLGRRFIAMTS
ncbi:MAG TPA: hypothetical protein VGF82_03745, partial [Terracidiphilus sp.]